MGRSMTIALALDSGAKTRVFGDSDTASMPATDISQGNYAGRNRGGPDYVRTWNREELIR